MGMEGKGGSDRKLFKNSVRDFSTVDENNDNY